MLAIYLRCFLFSKNLSPLICCKVASKPGILEFKTFGKKFLKRPKMEETLKQNTWNTRNYKLVLCVS